MQSMRLVRPASNFSRIDIKNVSVWFSYETAIGFQIDGQRPVLSENIWSQTTGKHLNQITRDKSARIPHGQFETELAQVLENL